jgi:stage II sporulation protein D
MMMRGTHFLIFTFLQYYIAIGQDIKVSIFNDKIMNSVTLDIKQGNYVLKSGNETLGEYRRGNIFFITRFGGQIQIRDKRSFIGNFSTIEFNSTNKEGIVTIKSVNPNLDEREYEDDILFKCFPDHIQIINKLDMEKYIAAVIEAEGGNNAPAEYYKAQAVLIRTFTIKNMFKHAEEGFNLCDLVHCQAYNSRSSQHPEILKATLSTAGLVLIDKDSVLVMSSFHSNCGGETSEAGMVWQKGLPYLQPIIDPFCLQSAHAYWKTSIPRDQWIKYLNTFMQGKLFYADGNFTYKLIHRAKIVRVNGIDLNLRNIRETFNLKSTFFSINDKGNEIEFSGRGYGHGAGMCQEGAMEMAKVGYTWLDIIHLYYQHVELADYRDMELHRY